VRTAALPDTRHGMPDEQLLTALLTDGSSEQTVPGITGREREREREREKERVRETEGGGGMRGELLHLLLLQGQLEHFPRRDYQLVPARPSGKTRLVITRVSVGRCWGVGWAVGSVLQGEEMSFRAEFVFGGWEIFL